MRALTQRPPRLCHVQRCRLAGPQHRHAAAELPRRHRAAAAAAAAGERRRSIRLAAARCWLHLRLCRCMDCQPPAQGPTGEGLPSCHMWVVRPIHGCSLLHLAAGRCEHGGERRAGLQATPRAARQQGCEGGRLQGCHANRRNLGQCPIVAGVRRGRRSSRLAELPTRLPEFGLFPQLATAAPGHRDRSGPATAIGKLTGAGCRSTRPSERPSPATLVSRLPATPIWLPHEVGQPAEPAAVPEWGHCGRCRSRRLWRGPAASAAPATRPA